MLSNNDLKYFLILLIAYLILKISESALIRYHIKVNSYEIISDWYLLVTLCYLIYYKIFKK